MIVNAKSNVDPAPAGNHVARCFSIVDLGTQKREFNGEVKHTRQVKVTWELPTEKKSFKDGDPERPYVVSRDYTPSLNPKSRLKQDLESWRGKPFTAEELEGFDLANILDKTCLLNVIHNERGYAEIASISPIVKGVSVPERHNELVNFDLTNFDMAVFNKLPEFVRKKIQDSPEYKKHLGEEIPDSMEF